FYDSPEEVARHYPHLAGDRSPGDNALAVLPLTVTGRTFGAMGFVYDEPRSFPEAERTQMLALARLCAQAMDRASLLELAQRERQHAEEANRAKDEFLAMVSHELRTPLNAMLGWTRMLRTGKLEPARREKALETIERNALAQTQLIEDLLDVTRIITGKLRLNIGPLDLVHVIEAAIEGVKPSAEAKGLRILAALDPIAVPVPGDADRLQQVVWNLLSNAVKFTERGGQIHIRMQAEESSAEIVVEDTGVGIAQAFLPHIFERFRQADGGTTRAYGGLGLGLAIVKHLVELHGGTVTAESEGTGRGARFTVRVPVGRVQMEYTPPVHTVDRGAPNLRPEPFHPPPPVAGLRVLVVEDEPDARELLVTFLGQREVVVRTAASAEEGLAQVGEWKPDVILSDIGMPVEDGYAFIQRVRALPNDRGGRTPAVALTAFARMEDRRKAMLAGYNMHLSKPIDPAELLLVLANVGGRLTPTSTLDPMRATGERD
ncbi:MAG: ATP-binding protein, partial [Myxococcota bacterium]|nr:ATP-binding protein [Myxococcota bacterium]